MVRSLPCFAIALSLSCPSLSAADFIRGDSNGDQQVSISDTTFILGYMFLGSPGPECENAGDADDSGMIDIADAIKVLNGLFLGGTVPAPFPAPGADPTEPSPNCESYGNGQPLEDPEAKLEIASAIAFGGADRKATIILALTSS